MRVFADLKEAGLEIKRDLYKSPRVDVTRVQQFTDIRKEARERLGFTYSILGNGFPIGARQLIDLAVEELGMEFWKEHSEDIFTWLTHEVEYRLEPMKHLILDANEEFHPALKKTFEGDFPSYTYTERLYGMIPALTTILETDQDSRRAYWPIFRPEDALRAHRPTRVPCSLGYEVMIRRVGDHFDLMLFYLSRSVDYDTFWLSDLWLAHQVQLEIFRRLEIGGVRGFLPEEVRTKLNVGQVVHHILSFHSFFAAGSEIY